MPPPKKKKKKIHKSNLIKSVCPEKSEKKCAEISNPDDLKFRPIVAGPVCETQIKVPIAPNYKGVCLQNRSKPHSYHLKIW